MPLINGFQTARRAFHTARDHNGSRDNDYRPRYIASRELESLGLLLYGTVALVRDYFLYLPLTVDPLLVDGNRV